MSAYAGVRIVDFSSGIAGPMAAMLLSDFAAETVKVEPPEGDRWQGKAGYQAFNRNKQILTLDLENAQDLARARELIAGADVAIFDHAVDAILGRVAPDQIAALVRPGEPLAPERAGPDAADVGVRRNERVERGRVADHVGIGAGDRSRQPSAAGERRYRVDRGIHLCGFSLEAAPSRSELRAGAAG